MRFCAMFLFLWLWPASTGAAQGDAFPDLNVNDPASLQEASRVLEEELALAVRPQTYVVVDLMTQSIRIKGHGIDLHRIPIEQWSMTSRAGMKGTFRLRARPGLVRRKLTAHATVEQDPISLADMPVHYELLFAPSMTMNIFLPGRGGPSMAVDALVQPLLVATSERLGMGVVCWSEWPTAAHFATHSVR
jgi:hypothetical protein